jgi:hypothetical protein
MKQKPFHKEPLRLAQSMTDFIVDNAEKSKICNIIVKLKAHHPRLLRQMLNTSEINYLTFRNDGTISYLPNGKELKYNADGDWSREGRQNGKASKVIRKIFLPSTIKANFFKDTDFELFANLYKAKGDESKTTFKIHSHEEIADVYCCEREHKEGSSLTQSCMNDDRGYLEMYTHCKSLELLAMYNGKGELCGRALIWLLQDGRKFMDRIYTTQEHNYQLFLDYAKDNKWIRKEYYRTYDYKNKFVDTTNDKFFEAIFQINTPTEFCEYPYIDTFSYGKDGYLTNDENIRKYIYNYTDGTRKDDMIECPINQCRYNRDEMIMVDRGRYRGYMIHENEAVEINNETYWRNDDDIVEVGGEYYNRHDGEVCYVDMYDEWYLSDDCVEDTDGEYILREEAFEVDGDYYHEDNVEEVTAYIINGQLVNADDVSKA